MKKMKTLNVVLTLMMLINTFLTPQTAYMMSAAVNEETEEVGSVDPEETEENEVVHKESEEPGTDGEGDIGETETVDGNGETPEPENKETSTGEEDTGEDDEEVTDGLDPPVAEEDANKIQTYSMRPENVISMDEPRDLGEIFTHDFLSIDDVVIGDGDIISIDENTLANIRFNWNTEELSAKRGDTAELRLSDAFEMVTTSEAPIMVEGKNVGNYHIENGVLKFVFNENVETADVHNGFVDLKLEFNMEKFKENIEQVIPFNDSQNNTLTVIAKPVTQHSGITKEGHPDSQHDAREITWTIDVVNTDINTLTDTTIKDVLPEGLLLKENSFIVRELSIGFEGDVRVGDVTNSIVPTGFPIDIGAITPFNGYRVEFTTIIQDYTKTTFTNNATLEYDDVSIPAEGTVGGLTRSNPIEKRGWKIGEEDSIAWEIDVNKNGSIINEAIVKDELPDGLVLDSDSIKVVRITQNGGRWMEGESHEKDDSFTGFPIKLGELGPDDAYRIRFNTIVDWSLVNSGDYLKNNGFKNKAILNDGTSELNKDDETVDIVRDPILRKVGVSNVNYENKTVTWTIHINEAGHLLGDIVLTDLIPLGLAIEEKNISIVDSATKEEFTPTNINLSDREDGGTAVVINLDNVGTRQLKVEYTTTITDFTINTFNNTVGMTGDGIGPNGEGHNATIRPVGNTYGKGFKGIDYNEKTIKWQLSVNPTREAIDTLKIEDTFPNKGMILLPDTVMVEHAGKKLVKNIDYTLAPRTEDNETGYHKGFTITILDNALPLNNGQLVVDYQTSYDPQREVEGEKLDPHVANSGNRLYVNRVRYTGETSNNNPIDQSRDARHEVREDSWNSGKKEGQLVHVTADGQLGNGWISGRERKIAWQLYTNYQEQNLGKGVVITDTLAYAGDIDENSIQVSIYNVNSDGTTLVSPNTVMDDYSVEVDGDEFTLTFDNDFVVDERYVIEFTTSVPDISANNYTNNATVNVGGEEYPYTGSVAYQQHNEFLRKGTAGGIRESAFTGDEIDWEVTVNESLSIIENAVITDTISDGHVYLVGSLEVYKAHDQENVLELGSDYTLDVEPITNSDGELTGETNLIIDVTDALEDTLIFRYKTVVTTTEGEISNSVSLDGTAIDRQFVRTPRLRARQFSSVGGQWAQNRGAIQIRKVDANSTIIDSGEATFELWYDLNGERIQFTQAKPFTTVDGKLGIGDLPLRTYYLREVKAPNGYIINEAEIKIDVTEPYSTQEYEVDFVNYQGTAQWLKVNENGETLPETTFNVLDAEDNVAAEDLVSNEDGLVEVGGLAPGEYTIVETATVEGYILNTEGVTFEIAKNATGKPAIVVIEGNFVNYKGSAQLTKTDVNGLALEGAVFDVYGEGEEPIREVTSDEDGVVFVDELAPGEYSFVEKTAPAGYLMNETVISFIIADTAEGVPATVEIEDAFVNYKGTAQWLKVDENGDALSGAIFNVLDAEDNVAAEGLVSNEDGLVEVGGLAPGEYTIVETATVEGYILNTEIGTFEIAGTAEGVPTTVEAETFVNYQGKVELTKTDSEGTPLEGAEFTLKFNGKISEKSLTTDKDGKILVEGLAPGDYTFTEITAPAGYIVDSTPITFSVDAEYEGEPVLITVGDIINYQGEISLIKVDDQSKPLAGAVFELRDQDNALLSDDITSDQKGLVVVDKLAPGAYVLREISAPVGYLINETLIEFTIDATNEGNPGVLELGEFANYQGSAQLTKTDVNGLALEGAVFEVYGEGEEPIREVTSGEDGVVFVDKLAPGEYSFVETKAPAGYLMNETVIRFTIADTAEGVPATIELDDFVNHKGTAQWLKVDENGDALPGATFTVLNAEGEIIVEGLSSNDEGLVEVYGLAPGDYTIVETATVEGYILNTEVDTFTVADSAVGVPVTVTVEDDFVNYQGKAEMYKYNEADETLEGAIFEVRDSEDGIVDTVTSDKNGRVFVEGLAPGTYTFVEVKSPDNYITNTDPVEFSILAESSGEPELVTADDFVNYQGRVELEKVDVDGNPLADAEFEIRDVDGNLIRGELKSDEDGMITAENLVPGIYFFHEVKAPASYLINEDSIEFIIDAKAAGRPVRVKAGQAINYKGSAQLTKTDVNGLALEGAVFEVYGEGEESIRKVSSDEDGVVFVDELAPGEYSLVEIKAPAGYLMNETVIPFTIADTAEGVPATVELDDFVNHKGTVQWLKVDENTAALPGATFNVLDAGGKVAAKGVSNNEGLVEVYGLAPGEYTIVETATVEGYILNTEVGTFTIADSAEGVPSTVVADNFVNYQGKVELTKTNSEGNPLKDAEFTLKFNGEMIEESLMTDERGKILVEGLAPGDYTFTEITAPSGYIIDSTPITFSVEAEGEGEPVLITVGDIINYQGKASIIKVDGQGNPLADAVFELRDAQNNLLRDDITSDQNGHVVVDNLAPGEYVLREIIAPTGYVLNTELVPFTIEATSEGKPVVLELGEFVNYQGTVEVLKTDEDGNPLADAEFTVLDSSGTEVRTGLMSDTDGRIIIEGLAPGKYTLVETKAPEGYVLATETYDFEILNEALGELDLIIVTVTNKLEPEEPKEGLPALGEGETNFLLGALLLALGGLLVLYDEKWSKKRQR